MPASTAVLAQEMVNQGLQLVVSGYNPVLMQKGMRAGGFGDDTVKASSPATPLWDVFKAKSSSL